MTDKELKAKIIAEIERLSNFTKGYYADRIASGYKICCSDITAFINSIPEEPVSEDLEEAALIHFKDVMEYEVKSGLKMANITSFKTGAKWQKEQFEKNRLAHCDAQTEEEAEREQDFVMGIIDKEHRQPTFDDAIKYGMKLKEVQMMAGAVDVKINRDTLYDLKPFIHEKYLDYKIGDKCKMILIKED